MTFIIGGALLIGLTLGMLGSGGSAITVPILVYLVGHEAKASIAESMAIVGIISVVAAVPYAYAKQINWQSVLYFGLPGVLGTYLGALAGSLAPTAIQMLTFAAVVLLSAAMTLRTFPTTPANHDVGDTRPQRSPPSPWILAIEGAFTGAITGFVGVGGGFLIVPALVFMGKLRLQSAIGTSLVIIAINALAGFTKYQQVLSTSQTSIDLPTIMLFTGIGIAASFLGRAITTRLHQATLKKVFATVLIVLGVLVAVTEAGRLVGTPSATPNYREKLVSSPLANANAKETKWKLP